jgi:hypothetical protein
MGSIIPHRLYRPAEIAEIVGGCATVWRGEMESGRLPSIVLGYGPRRCHRAATGAAVLNYLGLSSASHGEDLPTNTPAAARPVARGGGVADSRRGTAASPTASPVGRGVRR